jgi:hypothetical protein
VVVAVIEEHVARAIREGCPYLRDACFLGHLGECAIVQEWISYRKPEIVWSFQLPQGKPKEAK